MTALDPPQLQWGHLVVEVEGQWRRCRCWLRRAHRFNGATSSSRWKVRRTVEGLVAQGMLQWGHLVVEVEGSRTAASEECSCHCFNGATSSSRWKARRSPDRSCEDLSFNGATSSSRWKASYLRPSRVASACFNGATSSSRWKGRFPPSATRFWGASMGPPRRRGGRVARLVVLVAPWLCFNGATSSSRWKVPGSELCPCRRRRASMGPPRRRGGRG